MRCPNGTRKNKQGVCEPKEHVKEPVKEPVPNDPVKEPVTKEPVKEPVPNDPVKEPVTKEPVTKRCPNGTRKNKQGVCEPKDQPKEPEPKEPVTKRCPAGTKKNKQGICEPKEMATPRTNYTCKYFKKPIYLSQRDLFQIHFDTPGQFVNYANLSTNPKLDCGYQSLFALGLLQAEYAKKSAEEVNTKGKVGIYTHELRTFFRINFGLNPTESILALETYDPTLFLESKLANNHATIILLKFATHGHYIVAYKYNNKLHFYDPQASKHRTVDDMTIFYYFRVKVDSPKLFQPIQKSLPYVG